jgi:hypothetical protein
MNSLMTLEKVSNFVDNNALLLVSALFVAFCGFFTLAYLISKI